MRVANLFGRQRLLQAARKIETDAVADALKVVQQWHADYHQGTLKADKETSREQAYNQDFFIKVLGYREKPAAPYTFEPKATTELNQLPDAILTYGDPLGGTSNVAAVVELKAASVPLDRPQRRAGNLSPVQQGFKYKPQYRSCPFVIVSNFYELRLYNDTQLDYERWTLDDLVDPSDDYIALKTFILVLHADNLVSESGPSRTQELLSDIRSQQMAIGADFYRRYKGARLELLRDLYRRNALVRDNIELGIEKTQKIIDRIIFCCFAEDRGLLPDDTLQRVLKAARESVYGASLWSELRSFFEAVDRGSAKLGIPRGYNGGLFAQDAILDGMAVSDGALESLVELSNFNFVDDLSVDILGHIFEQSITDLEEIKRKVDESRGIAELQAAVTPISRRKKDGIFYTPDYVVRHIVDETLGASLREEEERLKSKHRLSQRFGDAGYENQERRAYLEYQEYLQNIKVLDPACGSGAFLVHVFDYLLAENQRVDSILGGTLMGTEDYVRDILRNNIYGVDVNEESVEITRLSLWLKTAQPGQPLTSLDANIRAGNSIIASRELAGEHAFDWPDRFPEVFARGGFDVVVGNPPYGVKFSPAEKNYLSARDPLVPDHEIYVHFLSLLKRIVRPGGFLGYVFPNTFLSNVYGKKYRADLFGRFHVTNMTDLSQDPTFPDASVRTVVFCVQNRDEDAPTRLGVLAADKTVLPVDVRARGEMIERVANLLALFTRDRNTEALIEKVLGGAEPLSRYFDVSQGLIPYDKMRGHDQSTIKNRVWHADHRRDGTYKRELKGGDVRPYFVKWNGATWISYGDWLAAPREPRFFTHPRILVREITGSRLYAAFTSEEFYNTPSVINCVPRGSADVDPFAVLAVLNSKLLGWFHNRTSPKASKGLFPKILVGDVRALPLRGVDDPVLSRAAQQVSRLTRELDQISSRFRILVTEEFGVARWPGSHECWWRLNFDELVSGLGLKRSALRRKEQLFEFFESYAESCVELEAELAAVEAEIDDRVFAIYGLSEGEVAIVQAL